MILTELSDSEGLCLERLADEELLEEEESEELELLELL